MLQCSIKRVGQGQPQPAAFCSLRKIKEKKNVRVAKWIAVASSALLLVAAGAAEAHVQHPSYLRALAELRYARAHLKAGDSGPIDEQQAAGQIDKAIADVKDASIDDGKNLDDHPLVHTMGEKQVRLEHALRHLEQAHDYIELRQQDSYWKGLKANDAQDRIAAAESAIQRAMQSNQQ
jgi:hypothetical protein